MSRKITTALLVCMISVQAFSQSLSDKTMTFFGVDFSMARMIGAGFEDKDGLKTKFAEWNNIFIKEAEKYDLEKPFRKDKVTMELTNTDRINAAINTSSAVMLDGDYKITADQASSVVKNYDTQGKTGLGCVFVVEAFNKTKVEGDIYVVFFNIATKKVLLSKRLEEKPGGFGLKAYWARTILGAIEDCKSSFPKWVKGKG